MSTTIKNISISIDGTMSSGFNIELSGTKYRLDHFTLRQGLLAHNALSFTMHKGPDEEIKESMFEVCGEIIGKPITMTLQTDNIENVSLNTENDNTEDLEFLGVIVSAHGSRNGSQYLIHVEARSWDAMLNNNPNCKSFEGMTLNDIVNDVTGDCRSELATAVDARFTSPIPYCVQYNENDFQFLHRLARRYGEWLYNDGTQLVFGKLKKRDEVHLAYPSKDLPAYHVELKIYHPTFNHVASSYNASDYQQKEAIEEMQKEYNPLSEKVFVASKDVFTKSTLQNVHSGGYADSDSRETILNVTTKVQGRAEKAKMLTYSGKTYSSKLRIGTTLIIADNYITDSETNAKGTVDQDEILITELVHEFTANETYSNQFAGVPADCDYPPYPNSEVFPMSPSCRAKVMDNEDPNNLGRVRVQFDWQAQLDGKMMTPWLRIAQPYAGGGKGFSFIPEIGEEVMIEFEGGNAERPYVKGTMYNGVDNPDEGWIPNNNSKNQIKAIRTRNGHTIEIHDEGDDGFIRIYDNKKENYILTFSTDDKLIKLESTGNIELYAKNDIIMKADHDMKITVGNNRTLKVGNNDTTRVGNNQELEVGNDQNVKVGNDQSTEIGHNNNIQIDGDQLIDTKGNKDERVKNTVYLNAKDLREDINNEVVVVANSQQHKSTSFAKIDGGGKIEIKGAIAKFN